MEGLVRLALLVGIGAWSFALLLIGLLMLFDWPDRLFEWPGRIGPILRGWWGLAWYLGGAAAVAAGEYLLVMLLREVFPKASPALMRAASWAPWTALAVLGPIGVMLWSTT